MRKIQNLVGNIYGRLEVIEYSHAVKNNKSSKHYWNCKCECGNTKTVSGYSLKNGSIQSCGCLMREKSRERMSGIRNDITGKKFGRLTVLCVDKNVNGRYYWMCKCECGNEKSVRLSALVEGHTTSCGCYGIEVSTARISKIGRKNRGEKHYNYNKVLTDEERIIKRDTLENYNWRKSVFERDGYKCTICNKWSRDLQAHHIENYRDNPDKRYDINNGITLCTHHHKSFHKKYGLRNTNLTQLKEFIKENTEVID